MCCIGNQIVQHKKLIPMETTETKTELKRSDAPMQLAVQFLKDYKLVLKCYDRLEQQIEFTEHLIGMVELMKEYLRNEDERLADDYEKRASELMKKQGPDASYLYHAKFSYYFYYETALVGKGIYTEKELDGPEFQEKPISYFEIEYYHTLLFSVLHDNLRKLCLKRKVESMDECKVVDINAANPPVELKWTGNRENKNEFVQLVYGLYKAGKINNGRGEITKIVERLAEILQVNLGKHWQSNHSNSIHKRNSGYKPPVFQELEDAYENYVYELIEGKRQRA